MKIVLKYFRSVHNITLERAIGCDEVGSLGTLIEWKQEGLTYQVDFA